MITTKEYQLEYNLVVTISDLLSVLKERNITSVFEYLLSRMKEDNRVLTEEERLAMIKMLEDWKL